MRSIVFPNRETTIFLYMPLARTIADSIWVSKPFKSSYSNFLFFKKSQLPHFYVPDSVILQNAFSAFCYVTNQI